MNSVGIKSYREYSPVLTRAFSIAGIAFLLVFAIGYTISIAVDKTGNIHSLLHNLQRQGGHGTLYKTDLPGLSLLRKIMFVGSGLSMLSFVMIIIGTFRIMKASKTFIYIVFGTYVLTQGVGFGLMFLMGNAKELIMIFGIAGSLLAVMALFGGFAKDLSSGLPMLFIGIAVVMILSLISIIMYAMGVYSRVLYLIVTVLTGILALAFTMYDVGALKRLSQGAEYSGADALTKFRLAWFFGFRLLSDILMLIGMMVRILGIARR